MNFKIQFNPIQQAHTKRFASIHFGMKEEVKSIRTKNTPKIKMHNAKTPRYHIFIASYIMFFFLSISNIAFFHTLMQCYIERELQSKLVHSLSSN